MCGKAIFQVSLLSLLLLSFVYPANGFVLSSTPGHTKTKTSTLQKMSQQPNDDKDASSSSSSLSSPPFFGTWNPLRLLVLKLKFTEPSYTSPLNYEKRSGTYSCANCQSILFDSNAKYDSGSGWPSFWKTASSNRVIYKKEWDGRMEVQCGSCKGHLGHVFPDGPMRMDIVDKKELNSIPKDDLRTSVDVNEYTRLPRYCVNGASLRFNEREE